MEHPGFISNPVWALYESCGKANTKALLTEAGKSRVPPQHSPSFERLRHNNRLRLERRKIPKHFALVFPRIMAMVNVAYFPIVGKNFKFY